MNAIIIFVFFIVYVTNSQYFVAASCFKDIWNIIQDNLTPMRCINGNESWSYQLDSQIGQDCWPVNYKACAGQFQSPININTYEARFMNTEKRITCTKWIEKPDSIDVENTGQTISFTFNYRDGMQPILQPNPISSDKYQLDSAHIHFIGSEHTFNLCERFAMEAHLVFFNTKYLTLSNALNYRDGLVVIAKLYKKQFGVDFDFTFLRKVEEVGAKIRLSDNRVFPLDEPFGPINFNFYTYFGSLTTPGCNEVVTWILDEKPLQISVRTLKILSYIKGSEGLMSPNIRQTQPVNGRTIDYYNKF